MPETYDFRGFAPGQVTNADGTETVGVGGSIVLDPNWSSAQDAYTFVFSDGGDGILHRDVYQPDTGDDADQFLTVYDANGNTVASGRYYAEDRLSLTGSDGSSAQLYTIEINGVYQGIVADGQMIPGMNYQVDSIAEVGPHLIPELNGDAPVEKQYGPRAYPLLSGRAVRGLSRVEAPSLHLLQPVC
ncbi:MAG: hypothetical protein R3256_09845 [Thalassovita sp.]|nr:hypothetical protein [Thalassovita sp.]